MANYYVSSVAGDNGAGTSWATAKTTIAAGLALATADADIVYVDSAHAETFASLIAWDAPTSGTRVALISVNRNGSTTTGHSGWLAGASASASAAAGIDIAQTRAQTLFIFGVSMVAWTSNSSSNSIDIAAGSAFDINVVMQSCTFNTPMTNSSPGMTFGNQGASTVLNKTIRLIDPVFVLKNNATGASLSIGSVFLTISGMTCSFAGANKPATLFGTLTGVNSRLEIMDSDLAGYDKSGGFYFNSSFRGEIVVRNTKLHATPGLMDGTAWVTDNASITLINVDSGDSKNVFEYRNRLGTLTENASIYADNGGKFDGAGISWQVVTTSECSEHRPFILPWMARRSSSVVSTIVGFRIAHDSATDLHNRNLWSEIEYVSSASFPKGTLVSSQNAQPFDGSAADWTNDSETWTGISGFTNQNTQTISSTFTPAEASTILGRLLVGVASKTLYVDPLLRVVAA